MSKRSDIIGTVPMGTPYLPESQQSTANAKLVLAAVVERFPDFLSEAIPYVNILSFNEWLKRGYVVKKGEKAIRCAGARPILGEVEKDGYQEVLGMVRVNACVFAAPQVEPVAKEEEARAQAWEALGITRSDAQGIVECEQRQNSPKVEAPRYINPPQASSLALASLFQ